MMSHHKNIIIILSEQDATIVGNSPATQGGQSPLYPLPPSVLILCREETMRLSCNKLTEV